MPRLVWMAKRLHELKAPENVLKALGIFNPGPDRPVPAPGELRPSDLSDGQYAKFYIPLTAPVRQVLIQCDYHDGQGRQYVGVSDTAHFTDEDHPYTPTPQQRDYSFRPLGKNHRPIGKLSELTLTAVIGSTRGKIK
jgi:hypothetical protein